MSIISIRNLSKKYGENVILENVNAEIEKGEVISIIGPSGTGKSTLLRALNMFDPASSGEIYFDGVKIDPKNIDSVRKKMGMVFQNFGLFSHLTVMQNITLGQMKLLKKSEREAQKTAIRFLKTVGLLDRINYYPHQLSGGQKQRVAIARCLSMEPQVILLDEPTSALDPTMVSEVLGVIRRLAKDGMTMLIVTHEMNIARDVSSRIFYMDEKGIYEDGASKEIFEMPKKEKTRIFIHKIRNLQYHINNSHYDFYALNAEVEQFNEKYMFDAKRRNKILHLTEEAIQLCFSNGDEKFAKTGGMDLELQYSEKNDSVNIIIKADKSVDNIFPSGENDDFAMAIIRGMTESVEFFENEKNRTVSLKLKN
jgi:polar amino acid transport system ATP-binding protein